MLLFKLYKSPEKTARNRLNVRNLIRKSIFLSFFILFSAAIIYAQTPSPNFTAANTSGCSPLLINFQDQSTGNPTSWLWDFGNGATSTLQNPSTTYFTEGIYTVKLTATNAQGSGTLTRTGFITIYGKPAAAFKVSDSTGCFPLRAQFTDLSTPSKGTTNTTWFWDFGDGTQSSLQNPLHTYTNSGNYTVTFKITNDKGCYSVLSKPAYIKINGGVLSDFTNTQPAVCKPPFNISFNSASSGQGTLSYYWDFGDGTTSTLQNPGVHSYTATGNYTVSLATTSSNGCSDTLRKVNVISLQNVNTSFAAPDSACVNTSINFQNTSTPPPISSNWLFGDGTTSTAISPVKTFTTPGTYPVRLYNTYSYCTDSVIKTIRILPRPVANFSSDVTLRCQPPLTVNFIDASANAVQWQWNFGDGSTSSQQNPSHIYTSYGNFDVQLVVTNISGCTDTLKKNAYIKIIKPVITFPSLPQQGCIPFGITFSPTITTLDAITSYLWDFGDGNTSTRANPSYTYTLQGTYTVKLTITTSTGCTETLTLPGAIRVGTKPIVNFTAVPTTACAFQTVQFSDLTNEADAWLWNFGDGTTSILQNPLHQYADTGLFNVMLIATNNGCKDSLKKADFIKIKPPVAKFGFVTNCINRLQFNFIDSSIGATSWLWDFGDGTTSTSQNPSYIFPSFNTYNVSLTVKNDTCSHTITKAIKVIKETPDFTATATVLCRVGQLQFISTTGNPANIVDYFWDEGNGSTVTGFPAINATYALAGVYTVTLITTDIYGCKDTIKKPNYIRINGPTANFSATNISGCKGLASTFNDLSQSDGTSLITTWKWDFGDGTSQTLNSGAAFQHIYVNPGTYTVKLKVTDAGGCSDSLTIVNLITTTNPVASFFSADTLACPGSSVNFANTSSGINYTSFWNFGDGNTSTVAAPSTAYTNPGVYTVKLKITDQYGCADSLLRPAYIKVNKPVARFTLNDSITSCTPFEVQFTNTSQYYISSLWDLGGGTSTLTNPIQYYIIPGAYSIRLIVTSPGGCMDTAYKTIRVFDTVGSKITYLPLNGCKPLRVDLTTYTPGPVRYTWDLGDGNISTNDSANYTHIYNSFGNFVPKVILTDPSGCIIPVTGLDTIRIIGAAAKFGLDKRFYCDSGLVRFIDSTTFNDSLTSYTWNFGDGTTSTVQNPIHKYTSPGIYSVSLNIQTQKSCVDTFTLNNIIKIVPSPLISVAGDSIVCVNDFMKHAGVFNRTDTSVVQWQWQFPNNNTSTIQNPALQQYANAGNFVVTAVATNSDGCSDTATKNILVNPLPVVTMPSLITMQAGFPVTIPATYTSNVITYNWFPSATLSCADCPQPIASPKFDTKYSVSFVDSNSCRNTGTVQVIVICKNANVFVPNTFSPNGDGSNDLFYVRGRGLERVKMLRIFNRWGEIVFEQTNFPVNDPIYGWNGKYKGNKPVADVYVYQVEVFCDNSQIIRFEGNVALIQ